MSILPTSQWCARSSIWTSAKPQKEIFGGGVNAFYRYENGKTRPPLAPVRLLKWLERYPELLNEVRTA